MFKSINVFNICLIRFRTKLIGKKIKENRNSVTIAMLFDSIKLKVTNQSHVCIIHMFCMQINLFGGKNGVWYIRSF